MASAYHHHPLRLLTTILYVSYIYSAQSQLVDCSTTDCYCPDALIPGEKCILNCNTEDSCKSVLLQCRAGDPCEIRCEAKSACAQDTNIKAATATDVTLICNGEDTCKSATKLHCGTGDCFMSCQGKASCDEFGEIDISLSNSFQCSGNCPHDLPSPFTASPTIPPTAPPTTTQTPTISPTNPPQTTLHPSIQPTPIPSLQSTLFPTQTAPIPSSILATAITKLSTSLTTQHRILPSDEMSDESGTVLMLHLDKIHPLYYTITLLLVLIFIVCCALFCWIYISHRRTQSLIKQQQARLDSKSPDFRNIPMTFNGFPAFKAPSFHAPCRSDTTHHAITSPTATSHSTRTHPHPHAAPRMYRIHSAETTPITVKKHFTKRKKKRKHEGDQSTDSETTDSDTNLSSNGLSKEIWEAPQQNDGDSMTTTPRIVLPVHRKTNPSPYDTMRAYHIPPPPALPVSNLPRDTMKAVEHPSQSAYYSYTMTLKHVQQLQHALRYASGSIATGRVPPSVTEATNTAHSELSRCTESDAINSSILHHMNTEDMYGDGEAYDHDDSMVAVRHPTISADPYDHDDSTPMFHVQIETADSIGLDGLNLESKSEDTERKRQPPHVGRDEIENVMSKLKMNDEDEDEQEEEEQEEEESELSDSLKKKMKNEMENILVLHKKVVIEIPEIPEEMSKSFKSYSMEKSQKTPPKEFSTDCFNEDSIDPNELDRNSYAIQLVGVDEPTLTELKSHSKTTSTVIEDTYLKFLND